MKNSKLYKGTLALSLTAMTVLAGASAFAYQGDPSVQGPNYSADRHAEMTEAFESGDYSAWASLTSGQGRIADVVNADNFAQYVEAHELALAGDTDGAAAIRAELGLGLKDGNGAKNGSGAQDGTGSRNGSGSKNASGAQDGSGSRNGGNGTGTCLQ